MKPFNVFVYGTLMFENTFRNITGYTGDINPTNATLYGYSRHAVIGAGYPAIVPNDNSSVEGILIEELPEQYLARLDRYEGEGYLYLRKSVKVDVGHGMMVPAFVYVWNHGCSELANGDWEFNRDSIWKFTSEK